MQSRWKRSVHFPGPGPSYSCCSRACHSCNMTSKASQAALALYASVLTIQTTLHLRPGLDYEFPRDGSQLLACCLRHMVGIKYSIKKLNPQSWVRNSKLRAKFSSSQKALFELCAEGKFCHWVQMLYVFMNICRQHFLMLRVTSSLWLFKANADLGTLG